jgi:cytidylate kinase (EC 2.7.4.14)
MKADETQARAVPVLAIDGPTASGKGTVSRLLAQSLGFHLLDSGAIYRAWALWVQKKKIDINDINSLERKAQVLPLQFQGGSILLDGQEVRAEIREESVGMLASQLAGLPAVRSALLARQRAFAQAPGLVADGRDMGTIVFPEARLKIYLTASARVRAERRTGQLVNLAQAQVEQAIRQRDAQDKSRAQSPLRPAADALIIDNAGHEPEQTARVILELWHLRARCG